MDDVSPPKISHVEAFDFFASPIQPRARSHDIPDEVILPDSSSCMLVLATPSCLIGLWVNTKTLFSRASSHVRITSLPARLFRIWYPEEAILSLQWAPSLGVLFAGTAGGVVNAWDIFRSVRAFQFQGLRLGLVDSQVASWMAKNNNSDLQNGGVFSTEQLSLAYGLFALWKRDTGANVDARLRQQQKQPHHMRRELDVEGPFASWHIFSKGGTTSLGEMAHAVSTLLWLPGTSHQSSTSRVATQVRELVRICACLHRELEDFVPSWSVGRLQDLCHAALAVFGNAGGAM
ncbi:MAG: hypothetical protein MHM6MM_001994 [Cercozoa sp. M6MM]